MYRLQTGLLLRRGGQKKLATHHLDNKQQFNFHVALDAFRTDEVLDIPRVGLAQ